MFKGVPTEQLLAESGLNPLTLISFFPCMIAMYSAPSAMPVTNSSIVPADTSVSTKKLMWRKGCEVVVTCGKVYDLASELLSGTKMRDKAVWRCATGGSPVKLMEDVFVAPGVGGAPTYFPSQVSVKYNKDPFDAPERVNLVDLHARLWKIDSQLLVDPMEHVIRTDNRMFWLFGMDHMTGSNNRLSPRAVIKAPGKQSKVSSILGKPYIDLQIMDSINISITRPDGQGDVRISLFVAGFCLSAASKECFVSDPVSFLFRFL